MATQSKDYNFLEIEPHWQSFWEKNRSFRADNASTKPKYYVLDMFPYPSGAGLHIGHPEGYTATDIIARYKRARGCNVLHPIGWDAFGLPAEQHAVKTGTHPASNTQNNITNFKRQIQALGFSYDWEREIDTTDPKYFRWTQWIFLQLFKKGLAYVDERPVWWCPELRTVLANEEVVDGKSEVGGFPVERRNLRQWVLRITAYAERLLADLKDVDWPDSTKRMQEAWIGRSEGAELLFDLEDKSLGQLKIFTTRPDTLFGCTYMVLAPEHPLVAALTTPDHAGAVAAYKQKAAAKSDLERTDLAKDKSGVFSGSYAINPINGARVPIWIADYVLMGYGTGAIMAVPAHDDRDFEFATQYALPVIRVIDGGEGSEKLPYTGDGKLINSPGYDGLPWADAKQQITAALAARGVGTATVNYKLRDWLFSRQRYWGEPFPVAWVDAADYARAAAARPGDVPPTPVTYTSEGVTHYALPLPATALPLELPEVQSYLPSGNGESPLANVTDWLEVWLDYESGASVPASQPRPAGDAWIRAKRETNTMPQWAGSCWYYLRFLDPTNATAIASPEALLYWGVPDLYVGGAEHAVLHLLYARFWHKVLFDLGVVPQSEPFTKLFHQGIILGELEFTLILDDAGNPRSATPDDSKVLENRKTRKLTADEVDKVGNDWFWKQDLSIRVDAQSFKMSKSRGNVVNPDTIIASHGTDTLRLYLMFLGPLEAMKPWNPNGIEGVHRFLQKVWRECVGREGEPHPKIVDDPAVDSAELIKLLHETIKKVGEDIENLRFNTAISQLMICVNALQKAPQVSRGTVRTFLQLLAPLAPHIAEELWERLGGAPSIQSAPWPAYDPAKLIASQVKLVFQVNGKHRGDALVSVGLGQDDAVALAREQERVASFISGKPLKRVIYVPGKILNLVVEN